MEFFLLQEFLEWQIKEAHLEKEIEILSLCDNKEMSIGEKRRRLYEKAKGEYSWMIDDDDSIRYDGISMVYAELDGMVDCVGFKELCIFDGKRVESSCFSSRYGGWADKVDGYDHVRTPFFKTPIKTDLCLSVDIPFTRFGEDHQFARNIYPHLKMESFIDEFIYIYQHNSSEHNKRYGIT